jgi:hypothetical protein
MLLEEGGLLVVHILRSPSVRDGRWFLFLLRARNLGCYKRQPLVVQRNGGDAANTD